MTIRVFCSGQSNALGRGTGGPAFSGVSSSVRVWNNVNPLGANGTAFVSVVAARAAGTFELTDTNNHAVWFCDQLARTQFDTVDLTLVALGGASIAHFLPTEATFPMLAECQAVWTATGQAPADVFLWHQGEADTALTPAAYSAAFEQLVANLIARGVISATTLIILIGTAESSAVRVNFNRDVLQVLARSPRRAYAHSSGMTTSDNSHFSGRDLAAMGLRRIYAAWLFARARG